MSFILLIYVILGLCYSRFVGYTSKWWKKNILLELDENCQNFNMAWLEGLYEKKICTSERNKILKNKWKNL